MNHIINTHAYSIITVKHRGQLIVDDKEREVSTLYTSMVIVLEKLLGKVRAHNNPNIYTTVLSINKCERKEK